jgi:hypothetical protein
MQWVVNFICIKYGMSNFLRRIESLAKHIFRSILLRWLFWLEILETLTPVPEALAVLRG